MKITACDIHIHALLFLEKKDETTSTTLLDVWSQAASHFRGQVIFGYIDIALSESDPLLAYFEVTKTDTPTYRLLVTDDMSQHTPPPHLSTPPLQAELIKEFVSSSLLNKSKNTKEEQEPEINLDTLLYELKTLEDLASLRRDFSFIVVGLFKDQKGREATIFNELIRSHRLGREAKFAITSERSIFHKLKVKDGERAVVVVLNKTSSMPGYFRAEQRYFDLNALKRFVHLQHLPTVVELTQANSLKLNELAVKRICVLFASGASGRFDKVLAEFEAAATRFRDARVVFALVNVDNGATAQKIMEVANVS